ncbi:MAG TPA: diiron oxygenase [Burkholderiaceae bacterium]|nr:diiron oxygenase [Burkholderiaceae bacterium]
MHVFESINTQRYARCIEVSKRIRWDIERDVIRGREFDADHKFLPDGLSFVDRIESLSTSERRLLSQIQGRTYANMFGLVERFIGAKMLEVTRDHALGDQTAFEALIRFTDEELKHQRLFRRIELLASEQMPDGYRFLPQPNDVADFVLGKSTWAVLALTCHIEIFTQVHYRQSIERDNELSPLYKDVFFFHWKEESQHAIIDELEWQRENDKLTSSERDAAVDDLIALVVGIDGMLQQQATADVEYFIEICGRTVDAAESAQIHAEVLAAYRWQYIASGVKEPRFGDLLAGMLVDSQQKRVFDALAPILH